MNKEKWEQVKMEMFSRLDDRADSKMPVIRDLVYAVNSLIDAEIARLSEAEPNPSRILSANTFTFTNPSGDRATICKEDAERMFSEHLTRIEELQRVISRAHILLSGYDASGAKDLLDGYAKESK